MADTDPEPEPWYQWGRRVLYAEMLIAILVTVFSLSLAFMGQAGYIA